MTKKINGKTYRFDPSISNEMHKCLRQTKNSCIRTIWCLFSQSKFPLSCKMSMKNQKTKKKCSDPKKTYASNQDNILFTHHSQDIDLMNCLVVICRLIFYHFYSNMCICLRNPALCNLSKCPLAKHFFDYVPITWSHGVMD